MSVVDKYEYKLKTEQMMELIEHGAYDKAVEIADTIDWRRVRNVNMLVSVSNVYEKNRDYQKSYEVLKIAGERAEGSKKLLNHLCILAIRTGHLDQAVEYYDRFLQVAPKDPNQYILKYHILRAKRASIKQQIQALEQFKKSEYIEEWAYELAKRYEEAGMLEECIEECDDLILWFSEGKYVYKAMELKMKYKPLTPSQQEKYDRRFQPKESYTEKLVEAEQKPEEPKQEGTEEIRKEEPEEGKKKRKLGDTMKLGEALQNLFRKKEEPEITETESEEEVEEIAEQPEEVPSEEPVQTEEPEDDFSDLGQDITEIKDMADSELIEEMANMPQEELESVEEVKVEDMEKKPIQDMQELKPNNEVDAQDGLSIDDILAEWDAQSEYEPAKEEEQTPILSPEIQKMIDEIDGVEETKEEPIEESMEESIEEEVPEEISTEEEDVLLDEQDAEEYVEDFLEEELLDEEFEEELEEEMEDDYESISAGIEEEFRANPMDEMDDREIPDEDEPVDILSATTPLSRKETAKLIATGKTSPLPTAEIANALSISDTGFLVHSRYDLSGQNGVKRAGLTDEQKKLFSYFVPVRGMSEQLVDVLEQDRNCTNRQGTSCTGNLLIIGNKGNGKTVLAVDVVKAIQKQRNIRQGKVAIITGEALNKKKISDIITKLYGGALIIEKAGKLDEKTVAKLNKAMEKDTGEMLIVLEEQRKPLDRLLTSNREFRKKFTSRLEVPIFINDELVTFGQTYAQENGYRIDEMGILALYSRIDSMQREDHSVTIAEVKEVMDEAMAHSQKASAKKLVKRVLGKNTDDADRIILTEKDFNI